MDDQTLVAHVRTGDSEAAGVLLGRYQGAAYTVALRLMGNAADAEDLAQEVLMRAYTRLEELQDGASFSAWIRRIAVNLSLNALRRRGKLRFESLEYRGGETAMVIESADPAPDVLALNSALEREIDTLLARLPTEQRVAVVLRDMYGYDVAAVAAAQQCGISAAKMRIVRGRTMLRRLLGEANISLDGQGV